MNYLKQSLDIQKEIGDRAGLCATLFNMGHIHRQNKDQPQALSAWVSAFQIAREIGQSQALEELKKLAGQLGGEGLEFWERLLDAPDSLPKKNIKTQNN
jgi:hypothetical protein